MGDYFFFTRELPELRPADERPDEERPADELEVDLARPAEDRLPLEILVEVVLTVRPELDITRPEDTVLLELEEGRMARAVVLAPLELLRTRPAEVSLVVPDPPICRVETSLPARDCLVTEYRSA